jgi:hypothetical protein
VTKPINIVLTVKVELDGDEEKISVEEYFLIEAELKELLRDAQMFDWKEGD